MQILNDCLFILGIEKAIILCLFHTSTMSTMVMNNTHISMIGKIIHEVVVSLLVFSHTMGKLNNAFGIPLWHNHCDFQPQPVELRKYFFDSHVASFSLQERRKNIHLDFVIILSIIFKNFPTDKIPPVPEIQTQGVGLPKDYDRIFSQRSMRCSRSPHFNSKIRRNRAMASGFIPVSSQPMIIPKQTHFR